MITKQFKLLIPAVVIILSALSEKTLAQAQQTITLKHLAQRALQKNQQIRIRQAMVDKAKLDKRKAYEAYLPKVTAEATYTHMNGDLNFSDDFRQLLGNTYNLLVKEQVAIQTSSLPSQMQVNLSTPSTNPILQKALADNAMTIPPIQKQNFMKANINAQMLVFSGLKIPFSVKAATHQQNAMELLSQSESIAVICQVQVTYDKLAVIYQSEKVLINTQNYLNEQKRFADKAVDNGLAIELNRQRIDLALQQLEVKRLEIENNKKLLCNKIEELTGLPADSALLIQPNMQVLSLQNYNGNPSDRPDIKALDEAIMATDFKSKSEWAEYIPKIFVFGKKELMKENLTMLDPEWYVGVGLKWTIFDGFSASNNARQAKLDRIILENKKQEATELSELNLKRIQFEIEKNLKMVETTQKQANVCEQILILTKKQYENGLANISDYLNALNDCKKAHLDNITAIAMQRASVTEYLASSGKLTLDNLQ